MSSQISHKQLTRRDVLSGVVAIGAASALPSLAKAQDAGFQEPAYSSGVSLPAESLPNRACHSASALVGGSILIAGGLVSGRATNTALLLQAGTGAFQAVAPTLSPRARHAATTLPDGRVIVLGGFDGNFMSSVEIYDPYRNQWTALQRLPSPRADFAIALDGMRILLIGGVGPIAAPMSAYYEIQTHGL